MADRRFFVEFNTHNAKTGGWNYKQTKIFDSESTARKEFYNVMSTYIEYGDVDHVGAIMFDSFCNVLDHDYWDKPEPEPSEE